MYLKEIKAHGFKSFADNINIEFNKGITGVVGPNGSGKSNIVDAIRWVLGEQSVKSLRGDGLMSDVIFSGSKTRNPLNVASVTLVFNNEDKYLPLDYTEVSIKRRLYKDGTNEYFLNNEKCRLKDITDILLDSGIAKESFNIISQGKIEEILSNKPSERRVVFEEAANVLKYKKRKEDALRKLDRTHNNMHRLNDIINELDKQIEPLKKQAKEALEYEKINDELKNIEIALITNDITNFNYQYQEAKNKIEILNKEITSLATKNTTNETIITDYKFKITKLNENISGLNKKLIEISTLVEKINGQKQLLLERSKYKVNDKIHDNLIELKEKELKIETEISSIQNEINNLEEQLKILNDKFTKEENNIFKTKETKKTLEINLQKLVRKENNLKTQIDLLNKEIDNNSLLPYSVKNVIDNPKLRGIHNVIGNLIETDNQYSKAISTSLGLASSFIVIDNEQAAKEAINYLKNNNLGRATFFPLNIIKPKYIDNTTLSILKSTNGFIDIASNLVKYDSQYENIILNQLGNVIVAYNIDDANKISKKINYKYKIVTLDGELLHVGGSISGGINKTKNVITIKYELEETLKNLDKVISNIKEIENEINSIDHNLKQYEDNLYLINKEKLNLKEILNLKNNTILKLNTDLEQINNEIKDNNNLINGQINNEEEQILKEYYDKLKEKDSLINEIEVLNKKKDNLNEELENYELSLKKENNLYNEKNNELKELEIKTNRLDVKLDNLLNSLSGNYHLTYEKAKEDYKLEIKENLARNKVNSLKRQLNDIGEVNSLAPKQYEEVKERYEFLTNQKEDLINAENTLLEIIKEMDQIMEREFISTFKVINENFKETFTELFKGGKAELKLSDPNNLLETGIEIIASPPGKKLTTISLLSGGEKTFTAISLLFAIIKSRSMPFCILDEVEAALDEVNVESFGNYVKKLKEKTQFILITHKKKTMEFVDTLYGITMQESGVSKLVSVRLEEMA